MQDSWTHLRSFTGARIALGRSGASLPTAALLGFRLSHAHARDAVASVFDPSRIKEDLAHCGLPILELSSAAASPGVYLRRPDLGRRLDDDSRDRAIACAPVQPHDLAIVVSNGLSARAAHENAAPLVHALVPLLRREGWSIAPVSIVRNARVALADEVGHLLHARIALILLGERPGLGGGDSLGAYFTHDPIPGKSDAERNCVSNIRSGGLPPAQAALKLTALLTRCKALGYSGVSLKDEESLPAPEIPAARLSAPPH